MEPAEIKANNTLEELKRTHSYDELCALRDAIEVTLLETDMLEFIFSAEEARP